MSRVANNPVSIPSGVEVTLSGQSVNVKGAKGTLSFDAHPGIAINQEDNVIKFAVNEANGTGTSALAGTTRALVNNMDTGVSQGFEKKLELVGVGYRAQVQGNKLNLTLGFSHPVEFTVPEGISIEAPSQTEIVVKGIDSKKSDRLLQTLEHTVHPSHIKARVLSIQMNVLFAKMRRKNKSGIQV